MQIFGWFDDWLNFKPTFDPGFDVACPFCLLKLEKPVFSVSLMKDGDNRCYFYRAHSKCYTNASADERNQIEWALIDAEQRP